MLPCFSPLLRRRGRRSSIDERHAELVTAFSSRAEKPTSEAPPSYSPRHGSDHAGADAALPILEATVSDLSVPLRKLSLAIFEAKEIAWQEHKTHDALVGFMRRQKGWKVTPHAYGLDTAWEAVFEHGKGGRTMGFQCEEDALPGLGHACGHNLIAISGVAAALATAAALVELDVPGRVVVLGTPAEETDGGKIALLDAGAYESMDACVMVHPCPFDGLAPMLAMGHIDVEFFGHAAHAAAAPEQGINALDAAVLSYTNINALRQHTKPDARIHGIIKGTEGWVVNVIPAYSALSFIVRSLEWQDMLDLKKRVIACFKAAGEATGCRVTIKETHAYKDVRNNGPLGELYRSYIVDRSSLGWSESTGSAGSTDFGDVSYALPAIHPVYRIEVGKGEGNHTEGFAAASRTEKSHAQTLEASKAMAYTAWRFLSDDAVARSVKKAFDDQQKAISA